MCALARFEDPYGFHQCISALLDAHSIKRGKGFKPVISCLFRRSFFRSIMCYEKLNSRRCCCNYGLASGDCWFSLLLYLFHLVLRWFQHGSWLWAWRYLHQITELDWQLLVILAFHLYTDDKGRLIMDRHIDPWKAPLCQSWRIFPFLSFLFLFFYLNLVQFIYNPHAISRLCKQQNCRSFWGNIAGLSSFFFFFLHHSFLLFIYLFIFLLEQESENLKYARPGVSAHPTEADVD